MDKSMESFFCLVLEPTQLIVYYHPEYVGHEQHIGSLKA